MKASYYGGIPGNSFYITKTYTSLTDLQKEFASSSCPVYPGEYVLIDTDGRQVTKDANGHNHYEPKPPAANTVRSLDNGRLYMRANDGSPEYIGNITGPSGVLPTVLTGDYTAIQTLAATAPAGSASHSTTSGDIATVPGSPTDDDIEWYTVNLQTPNGSGGVTAEVKIGLKIPYPTFTFNNVQTLAYNQPASITEDLTTSGKFYHNYNIGIPQGPRGTQISDVEIKDGVLEYNETEYNTSGPQPAVKRQATIKDYPYKITYTDTTGLIESEDAAGNTRIINIKDASGNPIPIQSVKKSILVNNAGDGLNKHLLIQWNLTTLNTKLYAGEYWQDLGVVDANFKLGYYADLSTVSPYAGNSPAAVLSMLQTDAVYGSGLPAGYETCALVYNADPTNLSSPTVLFFYDTVASQWRMIQGLGGGGGGDSSVDYLFSVPSTQPQDPNGEYDFQVDEDTLKASPYYIDISDTSPNNYKLNVYTDMPIATVLERSMIKVSGKNVIKIKVMVDESTTRLTTVRLSFTQTTT